jgi:hypothetical protein
MAGRKHVIVAIGDNEVGIFQAVPHNTHKARCGFIGEEYPAIMSSASEPWLCDTYAPSFLHPNTRVPTAIADNTHALPHTTYMKLG